MVRVWIWPSLFWAAGLVLGVVGVADGAPVVGGVELVVFAALGVVMSPLVFPRAVSAREAQDRAARDGRPVVYWRPGCQYCLRLRFTLGRAARRASWVNIWRDPDGAAAVRAVTGGDETVPTVLLPDGALVNPDPRMIRTRLTVR